MISSEMASGFRSWRSRNWKYLEKKASGRNFQEDDLQERIGFDFNAKVILMYLSSLDNQLNQQKNQNSKDSVVAKPR